jgi:hypothetical protein
MLCTDYYEACQRKNRANSWNDCHSRVEVSRQQAQQKICWDFMHALLELAVWLQAGDDRAVAIAAGGGQQSGLKKRLSLSLVAAVRRPLSSITSTSILNAVSNIK